MTIQYYRMKDKVIAPYTSELTPSQWNDEDTCIEVRTKNRKEAADYIEQLSMFEDCRDYIEHPENYTSANRISDFIIISLVTSDHRNIYKEDYVTMIVRGKLVLVLLDEDTNLLRPNTLPLVQLQVFDSFAYSLFYFIGANLVSQSNTNMIKARKKIQRMENELTHSPTEVEPEDLMHLVHDINTLADIIEDQGIDANFITSIAAGVGSKSDVGLLKDLMSSFAPLETSMVRLVEKAESLRVQYMLIQQERSSRKINFLTIVQSIFVPLTFIAGIYGMNFKVMPELDWQYGYYITWGVVIIISAGLLYNFKKNGWFD